ncbi:MAG: fibronectin type III domain-containing protein, partial [Nitrospirae bacterium]|nr:fibronectin type III domain-containing protein [Nitrospirota bacterium]
PGATSFTVSGLNPGVTYYFVIRAQDEAGNKDTNTNEMSATTLIGSDVIHPVFGGVESAMPNSPTEITLTWPPASDNASAASRIVYLVYMSTTPGGENFAAPSFATLPGAASFTVSGLNPGVTYYFVIRAQDEAGNKDTNTIEKSATTLFIDLFPDNVTVTNFIRFDVDNSGNMAANNVQVYIQDSDGYSIYCNFYTVTVPPGGSVHLSHYAGYTPMTYTIRIDPRNLISETDETNNVSCRRSFCTTPPSLSSCSAAAP